LTKWLQQQDPSADESAAVVCQPRMPPEPLSTIFFSSRPRCDELRVFTSQRKCQKFAQSVKWSRARRLEIGRLRSENLPFSSGPKNIGTAKMPKTKFNSCLLALLVLSSATSNAEFLWENFSGGKSQPKLISTTVKPANPNPGLWGMFGLGSADHPDDPPEDPPEPEDEEDSSSPDFLSKVANQVPEARGRFLTKLELRRSSKFKRSVGRSIIENVLKLCANELA
jgi:hypothetical protein